MSGYQIQTVVDKHGKFLFSKKIYDNNLIAIFDECIFILVISCVCDYYLKGMFKLLDVL